ncbi:hypothetical protein A5888_000564 [Enterococcus sp. 9E7_DIV0242]|uniref:Uncharacterized protein n=2 Tax=Candidatus Enterococcus clewellii TaxID=1834193 RepID=A0A242KC86_9ENTE|nr:hypothetical protein A5888_000597 [Enterococcus sp. 9E7_DIV0242]
MTDNPEDFLIKTGRSDAENKNRRSILKTFIQQKLMKDGNIITNYLPDEEQQNVVAYGMFMYIKEKVFHKENATKWYKTERFK